jgi:hypothetical protein
LQRPSWLPANDRFFSITVPYWCIALAAAILPAIWLYRTREQRESRPKFRFGVRSLLALTALCALVLTGYVHLGSGGAILVVAAALASFAGVMLLRRRSSSGRASTVAQKLFGVALVCIAVYHAYLFVDCYVYYRAWAPYNSMSLDQYFLRSQWHPRVSIWYNLCCRFDPILESQLRCCEWTG